MDRRRPLAALLALTALALAIAGMIVWREMSPSVADLASRHRFLDVPPPRRLHPLRAELLWTGAAVTGVLAVGLALLPHMRRGRAATASG